MKRPSFFSKKEKSPSSPGSPKRTSWAFKSSKKGRGASSNDDDDERKRLDASPARDAPRLARSNSSYWARHGSAIIRYASSRRTSAALLSIRHATGYDDLEMSMQVERGAMLRELARTKTGEPSSKVRRDFREKMRSMLLAHTSAMREEGLVFEHTFAGRRLGMQIALARYGDEGREFIQIDGTEPFCDLYPGPLKPTDELIA